MSSLPSSSRLELASKGYYPQLLQVIQAYGPGDETDEEGRTLIHYCVENKAWQVVTFLLQLGINVDTKDGNLYTALHNSCKKGCSESALFLLQNKANPREVDSVGSTPLHYASYAGNPDVVKVLLYYGADINAKCKFGWTPLHYASEQGHAEVVDLLLSSGAAIDSGRQYSNGMVQLSAVDMAQNLSIKNKLEVNMLSSIMDGFSL